MDLNSIVILWDVNFYPLGTIQYGDSLMEK